MTKDNVLFGYEAVLKVENGIDVPIPFEISSDLGDIEPITVDLAKLTGRINAAFQMKAMKVSA
jgi:hypothetical protein